MKLRFSDPNQVITFPFKVPKYILARTKIFPHGSNRFKTKTKNDFSLKVSKSRKHFLETPLVREEFCPIFRLFFRQWSFKKNILRFADL